MADLLKVLEAVQAIIQALQAMGLKVEGTVNIADLLKLIPRG
jgi:hypothetical protein